MTDLTKLNKRKAYELENFFADYGQTPDIRAPELETPGRGSPTPDFAVDQLQNLNISDQIVLLQDVTTHDKQLLAKGSVCSFDVYGEKKWTTRVFFNISP